MKQDLKEMIGNQQHKIPNRPLIIFLQSLRCILHQAIEVFIFSYFQLVINDLIFDQY